MKIEMVARSIVLFGIVLSCSCAHYACDPAYVGPKGRSAELLDYYSYPKSRIEAAVRTISERRQYVIERIEFPSAANVFGTENVKVDFYVQKKIGNFPTILIWPIADDADFCARGFAEHFAAHGFNCAVIHNRRVHLDEVVSAEQVEEYFRQTVLDGRQVLDYLGQRKEVDADRIGALGMSLGGIRASIVSAVDPRIKCSVIGLAGGSMADIALSSKLHAVRKYIKGLGERGANSDIIRAELTDKVRTDPLALAPYLDAKDVLMVIAGLDHVIPTQCGNRLWKAMGKPEVFYLLCGHFTSLLYLPWAEGESLSFFKKNFHVK
jgi:dienelactone hydrolase